MSAKRRLYIKAFGWQKRRQIVTMKSKNAKEITGLKAAEKSLAESARHFSGLSPVWQPKVLIKTFGWQMDAVLYDYHSVPERDLVMCNYL